MPKKIFSILALIIALTATVAFAAEWRTDYDKALAAAKASNKYVLLDFNGSDWCGPCIEMKKVGFSKPAFLAYANTNLVLIDVLFHSKKNPPESVTKQNERLARQYDIERSGYPPIVLLDPSGKV